MLAGYMIFMLALVNFTAGYQNSHAYKLLIVVISVKKLKSHIGIPGISKIVYKVHGPLHSLPTGFRWKPTFFKMVLELYLGLVFTLIHGSTCDLVFS